MEYPAVPAATTNASSATDSRHPAHQGERRAGRTALPRMSARAASFTASSLGDGLPQHEAQRRHDPAGAEDLQTEAVRILRGAVHPDVLQDRVELAPLGQRLVRHAENGQVCEQRDAEAVEEQHVTEDLQEVREAL